MTNWRPSTGPATPTGLMSRSMGSETGAAAAGVPPGKRWRGWRPGRWQESSSSEHGVAVKAYTLALGGIRCDHFEWDEIDRNALFCPDAESALAMEDRLREVKEEGDSVGGIVAICAQGCPAGLGEPVFDKLDARLAGALMSIGAVKGVEIGEGFTAADLLGSENNDPLTPEGYASNHAGGILGGISTGLDIVVRVAVKPIPSISKPQTTVNAKGRPVRIKIKGRHDVSAIPRIVPVCEAMVLLVLADFILHPFPQRRGLLGLG